MPIRQLIYYQYDALWLPNRQCRYCDFANGIFYAALAIAYVLVLTF